MNTDIYQVVQPLPIYRPTINLYAETLRIIRDGFATEHDARQWADAYARLTNTDPRQYIVQTTPDRLGKEEQEPPMSTTETTYNGWTNYATWRVNLEICDEYLQSIVDDAHHGYIDKYANVSELAGHLETYVDDVLTDFEQTRESIALDYARAFVSDVNWYEIAEHWTDELVLADDDDSDAA